MDDEDVVDHALEELGVAKRPKDVDNQEEDDVDVVFAAEFVD